MPRLLLLTLLFVGLVAFVRHFGGFLLARLRAQRSQLRARDDRALARRVAASPGGSPANPMGVRSAAVIETRATNLPCARCGGSVRVDEHRAVTIGGQRLRVVTVVCVQCSFRREVYFRLEG